jgi:anti-sigma factor RsiW
MRINRSPEHLDDDMLVAYLDGEVSATHIRRIRNHLKSCWNCRSVLSDLESQAEAVSRLLTAKSDSDVDRSVAASEKFLRWRASFEKRRRALLKSPSHLSLRNAAQDGDAICPGCFEFGVLIRAMCC